MKYAILEHGGKQYVAEEGGRIEIDRLAQEVGKSVEFKSVLLVADGKKIEVGSPYVNGAKVKGKVLEHAKAKKVTVFKYKPKERYRRKQGHRQQLTRVSIEEVALGGSKAEAEAKSETSSASKSQSAARTTAARRSSKRGGGASSAKSGGTSKRQAKSGSSGGRSKKADAESGADQDK
jgi:large subunit ribosomal protein L21